eukprot:COSAG02_NODE_808_length_16924_cov_117.299733_2_plen_133_part_00
MENDATVTRPHELVKSLTNPVSLRSRCSQNRGLTHTRQTRVCLVWVSAREIKNVSPITTIFYDQNGNPGFAGNGEPKCFVNRIYCILSALSQIAGILPQTFLASLGRHRNGGSVLASRRHIAMFPPIPMCPL